MTAWSHLPNAAHIDRILADLKARPQAWGAARGAARDAARDDARDAARDAARGDARGDALDAAWVAARSAAWGAARDAAWGAARDTAWGAIAALVAWDDCAHILEMSPTQVGALADIGHNPSVLLLPAVIVFNT